MVTLFHVRVNVCVAGGGGRKGGEKPRIFKSKYCTVHGKLLMIWISGNHLGKESHILAAFCPKTWKKGE